MWMTALAGWTEHTEASREFAQDFAFALQRAGISRTDASELMDISEQQLSRQLAGREGLNLWKAANLPRRFHAELFTLRLARIGCDVVPPGELRDLLATVRLWVGRKEQA